MGPIFLYFQEHIFHLMKSDSYSRYARSDMYKEFLGGAKKKVPLHFPFPFATSKIKGEGWINIHPFYIIHLYPKLTM